VVLNESLKNIDIEESLFVNELVHFKIVKVLQSTGIPTVEVISPDKMEPARSQLNVQIKTTLNTIKENSYSSPNRAQPSPSSNTKKEPAQSYSSPRPILDQNSNYSTQYIKNKNLDTFNLNEIEEIDSKDFVNTDLPNNSTVYVTHFQSPSDFVVSWSFYLFFLD
jgi:hypothetical protein